jgi:hypothetical protein
MLFLKPHYKFISYLITRGKAAEFGFVKKIIKEGLESGKITFHHEDKALDIDLKAIEKERGKTWANALRKQLSQLCEVG